MQALPAAATPSPPGTPRLTPGQKVRAAREGYRLSREKLAYEAEVSASTIKRLELDDQLPSARALARIAARLDIPVAVLLPAPDELAATSP